MSDLSKAKRLRFTYEDDLVLLREIVGNNPFKSPEVWEIVVKNVEILTGKTFSVRTLKHHIEILIEMWLKKEQIEKVRSGIEEPISERDQLLLEVSGLAIEFKRSGKRKIVTKEQKIAELGKKAREMYSSIFKKENKLSGHVEIIEQDILPEQESFPLETQGEFTQEVIFEEHNYINSNEIPYTTNVEFETADANKEKENIQEKNTASTSGVTIKKTGNTETPKKYISGPNRSRQKKDTSLRKNALSYLTDKNETYRDIRKKEIELEYKKIEVEERKLALEEARLDIERKKHEMEFKERQERTKIEIQKAEIELSEKKITSQLLQSQQTLIEELLNKRQ